jgi:acyl carrier protein
LSVLESLYGLVRQVLHDASLATDEIKPESRLREDLGMDSVSLVDLMVELESLFDIWFDPLDPQLSRAFQSVQTLARFVEMRQESVG